MGKHNRNQHNRSLQERLSFDQEDARLKLLNKNSRMVKAKSTSNAIRDAREILANKNKSLSPNAKSRRRPLPPRKKGASASVDEPLMIITGLDNVRRDGNRVKVVSRPNPEKTVVMDGKRTLITLRNTNASSPSKSNGKQNSSKPRSSSGNNRAGHINNYDDEYKLISVKIKNDLATGASASSSSSNRRATSPSPSHFRREEEKALYDKRRGSNAERGRSRTPSPQRTSHSSHYSSQSRSSGQHYKRHEDNNDNDMEYESSSASNRHEDNPNGYKIVVSNLHPRVTEEDILELFSDIGPIKRARFLDKGIAEVLYVKIEHAKEAIYKYDKNELDGRQMRIELVGSSSSSSSRDQNGSSKSNSSSSSHHHHHHSHHRSYENEEAMMDEDEQPVNSLSNKFKLLQRNEATSVQLPESSRKSGTPNVNVDSRLVQQVLFNKANSSDITFTVKL